MFSCSPQLTVLTIVQKSDNRRVVKMISNRFLLGITGSCLLGFATFTTEAQTALPSNEGVTKWWPDLKNNLIWTGQEVNGPKDETYDQSVQLCKALVLDGMNGWRLPTIDELDGVTQSALEDQTVLTRHLNIRDTGRQLPDGFVRFDRHGPGGVMWSSTPGPKEKMVMENILTASHFNSAKNDHFNRGAYCVRTMEPEIAAIARQALPTNAVANITELQSLIPLRQAFDAYNKGNYAASLAHAEAALAINPQFAEALYAKGLSQAGLGQWSDAVASFQMVKKLKWGSMKDAIDWAEQNEKAAASGKKLNPKKNVTPKWDFGVEAQT